MGRCKNGAAISPSGRSAAELDGTLHQTWARVGVQPRVDTFGMRKTAHLFGALSLERRPRFQYQFAAVFNAQTFMSGMSH